MGCYKREILKKKKNHPDILSTHWLTSLRGQGKNICLDICLPFKIFLKMEMKMMKRKRKMKLVHLKDMRKRKRRRRTRMRMRMKMKQAQNWEREKRKWASHT